MTAGGSTNLAMQNLLLIAMWVPMIVLGHVLSGIFFKPGALVSYVFFLAWPFLNFFLAYRVCQKNGGILVVRLVSFFFVEVAVLAIALLYVG
jgi:hypothetical protein